MSNYLNEFRADIDGRPATNADLIPLAFSGFAHFTAMQVRDRRVKGLDLHLKRLEAASIQFFGKALPDELVRSHLRAAVEAGPEDLSLTATIFGSDGEFTAGGVHEAPSVLVRTGPPSNGPQGPLKIFTVEHERPLPAIKHVGESSKTYYLRQAVRQGFDDAAFLDRSGRLSEGTIWNLAFWDGESVVWPEAAMLAGTTMGIVRRQLKAMGVPQRQEAIGLDDLGKFAGAVVMNSWTPGIAVSAIGSYVFPVADPFTEVLRQAYAAEPYVSF